jgi:hypothetical protein
MRRLKARKTRIVLGLLAFVLAGAALAACEDGTAGSSQTDEAESRQNSYDRQVAGQPAESMGYSPSRDTINFWIKTWDQPGKLSFVYLQGANGEMLGYYVLEGLPVSYCASLTPNYEIVRRGDAGGAMLAVPAPGVDGVYYSGGQCNSYYGKDATTGAYVEYTAGLGINVLLFDEPLPRQDVEPLGPTSVEDVPTG